ncbi:hypothetical protein KHC23_14405 [Ancylobacter dichloromethanicus]|nr:hypothetical protein [Ancylobacter dichloromethanicus]MBS7554840.1 hypothetical protein [Ancylobacter dichloromethanicus]
MYLDASGLEREGYVEAGSLDGAALALPRSQDLNFLPGTRTFITRLNKSNYEETVAAASAPEQGRLEAIAAASMSDPQSLFCPTFPK